MIAELREQGFRKTTAYEAAAAAGIRKQKSPTGEWWWASSDAPDPDFVQLGAEDRNFRARARSNPPGPEHPPKTHDNGSVERTSEIPADLDETSEPSPPQGELPVPESLRARVREAGDESLTPDEYAARFRRDQAEGRWRR
jgi:hypothetical protein